MSNQSASVKYTGLQKAGMIVCVLLCGVPALQMNGFGSGIPFSLPTALVCATIGGAVGGVLLCPRPFLAGLIGGLIAGPLGLFAIYYYTQHRERVGKAKLAFVHGIAILPGLGIGWLLKIALSKCPQESRKNSDTCNHHP